MKTRTYSRAIAMIVMAVLAGSWMLNTAAAQAAPQQKPAAAQAAPQAPEKTAAPQNPVQPVEKPVTQAAPPELAKSATPVPAPSDEYIIGAEDVLNINVWKEPDVTRTVPVRPDGKISLPLIGDIMADGLTPKQLEANLAKALGAYIDSPQVTVTVSEVRSQKFNIVGEVGKPGTYALNGPMTVLDALAAAGGLRDFAKAKKIYILRVNRDGSRQKLAFNYKEVIKGEKLDQNVQLEPRDTIVVP
jgi:polysaccharide export outer membrane protein